MTKQEFLASTKPLVFFCSINPETGKVNYEYLEGDDWDGYIDSIIKDFPDRIHFTRYNTPAKKLRVKKLLGSE